MISVTLLLSAGLGLAQVG